MAVLQAKSIGLKVLIDGNDKIPQDDCCSASSDVIQLATRSTSERRANAIDRSTM